MSIATSNILLALIFIPLALKWFVLGYYGQIAGQLTFVIPMAVFIYFSIIAVLLKKRRAPLSFNSGQANAGSSRLRLSSAGRVQVVLLALYILIISVGLFRSIGASSRFTTFIMSGRVLSMLLIAVVCFFLIRTYARKDALDRVWQFIFIALTLYIGINLTGALLGIVNPVHQGLDLVTTDPILSFWETRISFPFSANHQTFTVEAGFLGSLALAQLFNPATRRKYIYLSILIMVIVCMVAANARMPFMGLLAVLIVSRLAFIRKRKSLLIAFLIVLLSPILFTYVDLLPVFDGVTGGLSSLSRKGDIADLLTFNNRIYIWKVAFDRFASPEFIHLVGYGAYGHVVSGMSNVYAYMWPDPEFISLHNTYLQHLVDFGYIGLFVFVAMIVNAIVVLGRSTCNGVSELATGLNPPLAAIIYLSICALLDTSVYFYQPLSFFIFMFINFQVIWSDSSFYAVTVSDPGRVSQCTTVLKKPFTPAQGFRRF